MTASPPAPEYTRSAGDEPLPGYRLVAPLGRGGFGEVWRCVAPGGLPKAIKFVAPSAPEPGQVDSLAQEYEAFLQVKAIRHPFLLTLERVEVTGGELVMVMELADKSLANRFDECLAAGAVGIPRDELLAYMVDVAEALDVLAQKHGLQHLDVKPANLFLIGGHVKVGDYGLVSRCLGADEPRPGRGLTPRYVAPEILDGRVHLHSDQYPLALVYQELLTGTYPYPGPTARHLLTQHRLAEPNLAALGPADRPAVARALAKHPDHRHPTCLAFVRALLNGHRTATPPQPVRADIPDRRPDAPTPPPLVAAADLSSAVTQRLQPGLTTPRSGGVVNLPRTPDDLTRACPGFVQTAELDTGPRGRKVAATDPAGRAVRVHLLRLDGGAAAELDAVVRAVSAPHPHLWQQVSAPHPRTVGFVAPDSQQPLADWLKARAGQGHRPLRPAEAAALLAPVAAALDDLNARCRFPHALVNSRTVLVENDRAGVTGYGVGELLRLSSDDTGWLTGDPYIAPEVAAGQPAAASDQFGLAMVYLEAIGAWAPQPRARTSHSSVGLSVNWTALAESGLRAVRKALAVDPAQRFATCRELLAALRPADSSAVVLDSVRLVESVARLTGGTADPPRDLSSGELVAAVLRAAGDAHPEGGDKPVVLPDGRLAIRFPVQWTPSFGRLKTCAFADQFGYTAVPVASDTVLLKPIPTRAEPVELVVRWPVRVEAGMAEVSATGRWTTGLDPARGADKVAGVLGRFRRLVQNLEDRRKAPRVRAEFAVTVYPLDDDLRVGAAVAGRCRDVSASGFAATLDAAPPGTHAFARFDAPEVGELAVLAKLVRSAAAPGGVVTGWRFVHAG